MVKKIAELTYVYGERKYRDREMDGEEIEECIYV